MSSNSPTDASITLRLGMHSDLPAIRNIYSEAVLAGATAHRSDPDDHWWEQWWHQHQRPHRPLLVAVQQEAVVGWGTSSDYRPGREALASIAEVTYYVAASHQRRGIGSRLLTELLRRATDSPIENVVAIVLGNNVASLRLLQRHGFSEWGRLPRVAEFDNERVDHVYMGCALVEGRGLLDGRESTERGHP